MKKQHHRKMAAKSNSIPEEILFEILTMLPVKSLCRFRCVSKSWLSIFSDPNFVDAHLSRSKLRPKLLISVPKYRSSLRSLSDSMSFYSIEYPEKHHESSNLHAIAHGSIINPLYNGVISISSASGLMCCNCYQDIIIRNPITRKFNLIQHPEGFNYRMFGICYLGFDPIDNRQVLLKLDNYIHVKSSVFTLGHWHDIPPPQPFDCLVDKSSICINGVIYFIGSIIVSDDHSVSNVCECLYAFDVGPECFELIQHNCNDDVELLTEYKGCVALVCSEYDECFHLKMKLWILDDPKKHRWSCKYFAVTWLDNFRGISLKVCGITHRDELMFATHELSTEGSFDLFLYEIDTNTVRTFKVCGLGNPTSSPIEIRLDFLTDSLYSPK